MKTEVIIWAGLFGSMAIPSFLLLYFSFKSRKAAKEKAV